MDPYVADLELTFLVSRMHDCFNDPNIHSMLDIVGEIEYGMVESLSSVHGRHEQSLDVDLVLHALLYLEDSGLIGRPHSGTNAIENYVLSHNVSPTCLTLNHQFQLRQFTIFTDFNNDGEVRVELTTDRVNVVTVHHLRHLLET